MKKCGFTFTHKYVLVAVFSRYNVGTSDGIIFVSPPMRVHIQCHTTIQTHIQCGYHFSQLMWTCAAAAAVRRVCAFPVQRYALYFHTL